MEEKKPDKRVLSVRFHSFEVRSIVIDQFTWAGGKGLTRKGSEGAFRGDRNVLHFELGNIYTDAYICQKNH